MRYNELKFTASEASIKIKKQN